MDGILINAIYIDFCFKKFVKRKREYLFIFEKRNKKEVSRGESRDWLVPSEGTKRGAVTPVRIQASPIGPSLHTKILYIFN